jgi:hypothetical protein
MALSKEKRKGGGREKNGERREMGGGEGRGGHEWRKAVGSYLARRHHLVSYFLPMFSYL